MASILRCVRASSGARLLVREQRLVDMGRDADAAGLHKTLGVLLGQERAPDADAGAVAERSFASEAGVHVLEHRVEERGLELLALRPRLGLPRAFAIGRGTGGTGDALQHRIDGERHGRGHHITSMSAWMAPAALMACRMAMRSRGPTPSALRPSTSCCSDTPSLTSASLRPSSCTPTRVRGTTTVRPREKGAGWLTCGVSEMVTVRLPCATATMETRISRPITMMPERSSITILAGRSGSTCSCSISVRSVTTLPWNFFGMVICTVEGSSGSAVGEPMKSLTALAMRLAV